MLEKTLIQCDFDGTVTEGDVSFFLLDAYAQGNWHSLLEKYRRKEISVGQFNTQAFALIKESKETLLKLVKKRVKIRPGFREIVDYSFNNGFRFVIVSNGLGFYIRAILNWMGLGRVEFYAAKAHFSPTGIRTQYIGPDGQEIQDDFKSAYLKYFLNQGYKVVYIGNGESDIYPACLAHIVLARGRLLEHFQENNLKCIPFNNFNEAVGILKGLL